MKIAIILSIGPVLVILWVALKMIGYRMEVKRDKKRHEHYGKIIELDEFERKLSDDPERPERMHPKDWESFGYANNIN